LQKIHLQNDLVPDTKGMTSKSVQSMLPPQDSALGFPDLLAFLKRRAASIICAILTCLLLAVTYLFFAPAEYKATASLVIDQRKVDIFGTGAVSAESSIANASMETEIQMITSNRVAEGVVKSLGLLEDEGFMQGPPGFIDSVAATIWGLPTSTPSPEITASVSGETAAEQPSAEALAGPPSGDADQTEAMRRATSILSGSMEVRRVGLSYAINISYVAPHPEQAARLANGIAQAYLDDKTTRQVNSARRLSEWLETRIAELRVLAFGSELRAEEKSAIRATYDAFIQRYTQAVQQQSVPETDGLIITAAPPPRRPSSPNGPLIIVGALMLGTMVGSGVALGRELLDRKIRTRRQLAALTQSPCLGLLPTFRFKRGERREIAKRSRTIPAEETERTFDAGPWLSLSLRAPYSRFTETLRSIKLAADSGRVKVLGVVSAMPGEGKTTAAGNLARLIGATRDVLLIDADIRDPALSRYLTSQDAPGLVEVAMGTAQLADVVWVDQGTRLRFLPAGNDPGLVGSGEILGSSEMKKILDEAREKFEFIVVDLPPLLPVVDARAIAPLVDGFAFVVEWGTTTEDAVNEAILNADIEGKIIGSILTKVVLSRYRRFDPQAPSRESNAYLESNRRIA
jgi:capsular exopolysaccharide synthesis family protein